MSKQSTEANPIRLVMHPLVPRLLHVAGIETLTPSMRRITLAGLAAEAPFPFTPMATSDHVKLVFPETETGEIHLPTVADDRLAMPEGRPRPIFRDYTVRAHDGDAGTLDIDFVLHRHGPAGRWAIGAKLGDPLGVLGPRGSHIYPSDFDQFLIAGDETAVPAVARWLEELPRGAQATVLVSVASRAEQPALPRRAGTTVTFLDRSVHGAGVLAAAFAAVVPGPGRLFVWAAGEAGSLKPIRRHVREVLQLPPTHADIDGYWKVGVEGLDHHVQDGDD
ncbi:NADPH-dependent ferric siderophore reductase [Arthrobacter stackebrandtii]|uniref:NADPH-dependent ferric siderophore reductase n=1 Tax=Arthrobacter stackebrandtii TaxID=272161 RepID=A0ABS4Z206_9MICC|nr:siderophore-interacting protein [Arthrobacter stackebrandtii]MBP2414755.1 NADPH-dependent ferric siderophore reductase [Arthrobacter stackebrandtii]PYG99424.1 hypothetical protein CVV67_14985 [Arthrobacter stackebrandtii]